LNKSAVWRKEMPGQVPGFSYPANGRLWPLATVQAAIQTEKIFIRRNLSF